MTTDQIPRQPGYAPPRWGGSTAAIIVAIVAIIAAIVAIILMLGYRSNENTLDGQLRTVDNQLVHVEQQQQAAAKTASSANRARLGICWSSTQDSSTFDIESVDIESPILQGGVYACPSGTNFVSVVPVNGG